MDGGASSALDDPAGAAPPRRRASPPGRKQERYDRDHVTRSEYSIRTYWPRKKRLANKGLRARTRQLIPLVEDPRRGAAAQAELARPRRTPVRKWPSPSLREVVAEKLEWRRERVGRNFFKDPYRSDQHREPFAAFLAALVAERAGEAREHAAVVAGWFEEGRTLWGAPWPPYGPQRPWLRAFFADEPAWEARLTGWVEQTLERRLRPWPGPRLKGRAAERARAW